MRCGVATCRGFVPTPRIALTSRAFFCHLPANVVVSIDGQRLNNIDLQPQLLGAIPLSAVNRIEIAKGTGSVMQGDGAMAGAINITTRHHDGVSFGISTGSHGALAASATAGMSGDTLSLTVSADNDRHGGFSAPDSSGKKDASSLRAERARLTATPTHDLTLRLDLSTPCQHTLRQCADPGAVQRQSGAKRRREHLHQLCVGCRSLARRNGNSRISDTLKLTADHHRLDRKTHRPRGGAASRPAMTPRAMTWP